MDNVIEFVKNLFDTHGTLWIVGQAFGILAIILGFVSYQVKTQRQILFMQSMVAVTFCIHYFMIGAYSAMAMNGVNIVRNAAYDYRNKKGIESKLIPVSFVVIQAVMCALTWEAWYSVFVLIGICINTYCMSFKSAQNVRKSIVVTSPFVLTYDIFARSIGGSIYESVALVSAVIGIIRNRRK